MNNEINLNVNFLTVHAFQVESPEKVDIKVNPVKVSQVRIASFSLN